MFVAETELFLLHLGWLPDYCLFLLPAPLTALYFPQLGG